MLVNEQINPQEIIHLRSNVSVGDTFATTIIDRHNADAVKEFSYIPQVMHHDLGIISKHYQQ